MPFQKVFASGWKEYELLDAGGGKKLERWGKIITIRPEVQAYFKSGMPFEKWYELAHWEFIESKSQKGTWKKLKPEAPEDWTISFEELSFDLHLTGFKHLGIFPEQNYNWKLIADEIHEGDRFLNLFAYTGAASCVAKAQGADVYHVDSVKQLISWASENMERSGLSDIRWVHDDALKFAKRVARRGDKFDMIIMDPPAWGVGAKNEKWRLEDKLDELLSTVAEILSEDGVLILNTYSPKVNGDLIKELASIYLSGRKNEVVELWMKTSSGKELYYGNLLRSFNSSAQ